MAVKKTRRVLVHGSNAVISSVLLLGIFVIVALIVARHPYRLDLTDTGTFTLGEQSLQVLDSIKEPVGIKGFFASTAPEQLKAKDLLETYHYRNNLVTYEFVDPDRQPEVARKYGVRTYGSLVLEGFGQTRTIQDADEESITNALAKLGRTARKKVYFLAGHGEHSLEATDKEGLSTLRSALEKDAYQVAELKLSELARASESGPLTTGKPGEAAVEGKAPTVPADAAAVVVAGPRKPLLPLEVDALARFIRGGGRALVMLDPEQDGGLGEFLKSMGVEIRQDIVIDPTAGVFAGNYFMPVVNDYGTHKITEKFRVTTFFSEVRSVTPSPVSVEGIETEILASTGRNSWAETDFKLLDQGQAQFDEGKDTRGPVPILVLSEIRKEGAANEPADKNMKGEDADASQAKGTLIVSGDSDFADNAHFGLMGNGDLFLNMVRFLSEEENLITVERKAAEGQPLLMTGTQMNTLVILVLAVVPCLAILAGVAVYRIRRSQR